MMNRVVAAVVGLAVLALFAVAFSEAARAADPTTPPKKAELKPADRVVVMYFHRTQRCPTCLRMGSYAEEAVVQGFAEEVKTGAVEFHYVDFQDEKNAALVKAYKIGGPTLIVLKVEKNKPVAGENLTEIWTKNRDKDVFLKYVRDNVTAMQKPLPKKTARKPDANTSGPNAT